MSHLRKIFTICILLALTVTVTAQVTLFSEGYENAGAQPPGWTFSNTSGSPFHNWAINDTIRSGGLYSDSARVQGDTLFMVSPVITTFGYPFITLEFDHICDISAFDSGAVEVLNGASQWIRVSKEFYYEGLSPTNGGAAWAGRHAFHELSYRTVWGNFGTGILDNSWFKHEVFNVSDIINSAPTTQVRFVLYGNTAGGQLNTTAWYVDNVKLVADSCETIPPYGNLEAPIIQHNSLQPSLGPYQVKAKFFDRHSGVDTALIYFTVNGLPVDSAPMTRANAADSIWTGFIPRYYNNMGTPDSMQLGDIVCYYVTAYDSAVPCRNSYTLPDSAIGRTCNSFEVSNGLPLPYCDNFDVNNFWDDSVTAPATLANFWELGDPTAGSGGTVTPHSPPNSWVTLLGTAYPVNAQAFLISFPIDFGSAVTPRISFWQNRNMANDNDRLSLEYSISGGPWTRLGIQADNAGKLLDAPHCPSTWYNTTTGWNGSSGGWVQTFYQLPNTFNGVGSVVFRFKFTSDAAGVGYGVAIDDFCVYNPPVIDVSTIQVTAPGDFSPAPPTNHHHFLRVAGAQDSVVAVFRNLGTSTLTSIPVRYIVNPIVGAPFVVNDVITYPRVVNGVLKNDLAPLELDTFAFPTKYTVPKNDYSITVVPTIGGDADITNDTVNTKGHFGFITSTINYYDEFDGTDTTWTPLPVPPGECGNAAVIPTSKWEKGTPAWGATNSAYSSPNSWDINLSTAYGTNSEEYLYTQFFDLSSMNQAFVSFWQNRNTTIISDGFYLEYRQSPSSPNWYPVSAVAPVANEIAWFSNSPLPGTKNGWSGNSNGWVYCEFPLDSITTPITPGVAASQVQFRFVFVSDNASSTLEDGISIDNFRIINPQLYDVEMVQFLRPVRNCVMDIEEVVEIEVKNVGRVGIDSIPFEYRYRLVGSPTWNPPVGGYTDTIFDSLSISQFVQDTSIHFADMQTFGVYEFEAWVQHPLDTNYSNDTIKAYFAENVEGCNIGITITTAATIPLGSEMFMIDTTILPHDTIYHRVFSSIGPNQIEWSEELCMANVGDYKFQILPGGATGFITYWNLQDLFADTSIGTGTTPTGASGFGFHWECPPLLSASSLRLKVTGQSTPLPIPQDFKVLGSVKNRGLHRLRTVDLTLNIDRIFPPVPYNLRKTDSIIIPSPGAPILGEYPPLPGHEFDTTWEAEPGRYEICIWTSNPNGNPDLATHDDTTCIEYVVLDTVSAFPYCNNFDNNTQNPWGAYSKKSYEPNSSFEWGSPNQITLNTPVSAPNSWMTRLDSNYVILDSSGVYSPLFTVTDTSACYTIQFSHEFLTEYAFDGGVVEFTVDSGINWHVLGNIDDTIYENLTMANANWYNTPYVVGLTGAPHPPGWTGNSGGVVNSFYEFKFPDFGVTTLKVVFRFRFGSDASVNDEGWLIDDFCFLKSGNCTYWHCADGRLNQGETEIDCGGPCPPCESCSDGILNQNETDVDCGGVCPPCPSCVDGVQNGLEEQIDCGGPLCEPCASCNDGIRNAHWVEEPAGSGIWKKVWEDPFGDCGGPCPPCWVGIDELSENEFGLGQNIPNPTEGLTVIAYSIPTSGTVNVNIQNLLGQTMYQTTLQAKQGINKLEVDVNDWSDGVYYYSFEFNGERLIKKMTVNK